MARPQSLIGVLLGALLAAAALASGSASARADPRLAGDLLVADTHGQPFCQTRTALQRYLVATIRQTPVPPDAAAACVIAPYGTRVRVLQDLPPFGSRMHVVRAAAATPLQQVVGFTYSVGLYDARRFAIDPAVTPLFPPLP